MAQFDVHRNADPVSRKTFPLLLDIQADILESLATRVVVPLAEVRGGAPIARLMPVFEVDGRRVAMHTAELAGVPRKALGQRVGSLAARRHEIVAALDVIITGV
mgnify:CR=1 FL=1